MSATPPASSCPRAFGWRRHLWLAGGHVALALAIAGAFLPVLPTTPFLLLAATCYSRGSERLERWLLTHPRFGPPLVAWREGGVIAPRAKALAVALIVASGVGVAWHPRLPLVGKGALGLVFVAVTIFILTRPSRRLQSGP